MSVTRFVSFEMKAILKDRLLLSPWRLQETEDIRFQPSTEWRSSKCSKVQRKAFTVWIVEGLFLIEKSSARVVSKSIREEEKPLR